MEKKSEEKNEGKFVNSQLSRLVKMARQKSGLFISGVSLICVFIGFQNCSQGGGFSNQASSSSLSADNSSGSQALQILVNGKSEFTALPSNTYSIYVIAANGVTLDNSLSSLTAVSGNCPANRSWAPLGKALNPWTLDGTTSGVQLKIGANTWVYSGTLAQDMTGCQWKGCLVSNSGESACLTVDTTCPAGQNLINGTCGKCLVNYTYNASTQMCDPVPPVTVPPTPTPTTLPPATTTTQPKATTTTVRSTTTTTQPASCNYLGQTIASGKSVTTYSASSVPYGQNCVPLPPSTCNNGKWSPTYPNGFQSCVVMPAAGCFFLKQYQSGQSVTMYNSPSVPYGQSCAQQTYTCNNGNWTPVYPGGFSTCVVQAPPTPTPTTLSPPPPTQTTLPSCPSGLSHVTTWNGQSICGYPCNLFNNYDGIGFYSCPNGVKIAVSACQGGPAAGRVWNNIILTFVPTQSKEYVCTGGNVFP